MKGNFINLRSNQVYVQCSYSKFSPWPLPCKRRQRGERERERDMKSRCFVLAVMCLVAINEAQNSPQDFLAAHNTARSQVGVGPMSWDNTVAAYARNYAFQRVGDCTLMHSGGAYAENVFWGTRADFTATDAVNVWVSEKQYYNYGSNSCASGKVCIHYTQVVWRNSIRLGCARETCSNGSIFITCNYDPPGNYLGQRPYSSDNISPQDYLDAHNAARSVVGVVPLSWSNVVAAYAQNYAKKSGGDCNLTHSNGPYGENIFWGSSANLTAVDAVNAWVAQRLYYDYDSNTCASGQRCNHYTQVVWGSSTSLGCAGVTCNRGGVFITCNYDPPGNYAGQRPYKSGAITGNHKMVNISVTDLIDNKYQSPLDFLDFLYVHNTARSQVGVGPLRWNNSVAAYAWNYAKKRVGNCSLTHSGGPYGENIFLGSADNLTAVDAVNSWVAEKQYYDYDSNSCASGQQCEHYTQVVWGKSVSLGCARVTCNNGSTFITCNYDPPGNYVGQRPYSSDNISQNTPQDYLDSHNAARSVVGVGPLSWSNTVAAYAQNYAKKRVGDCNLTHSNGPYGENIFWGSSAMFTAVDAVNAWVAERLYYDYDSNTCASGQQCGHYTQVVWGNSTSLGCARVTCSRGGVFVTCNYDPPGNYVGQRPYKLDNIYQSTPQDYLDAHNTVRSHVGVGPLSWNTTVAAYAQNYAKKRVGNCSLAHSGGPYGENIFLGSAYNLTVVDVVNSWVAEKQYYYYDSNSCASGQQCGHYTQVVWSKSVRLGCARVMCNSGGILITCNYDPPGNYVGQRPYGSGGKKHSKGFVRRNKIIAAITVTIVLAVILIGFSRIYLWKKMLNGKGTSTASQHNLFVTSEVRGGRSKDPELSLFDLSVVAAATNNFSNENKLGEGGFGPVYKGMLPDGKAVAVKRLSMRSQQGRQEFENEVILISKLQHRNLVRLLGCCIHGEENILIYEYMPNKSLDFFLFGKTQATLLNWVTRYNIITGIARGLLYLHQDSRLRIIHRDLKASNILLDDKMNPKISDFGMARMFGDSQIQANTSKVVGTYGYMAPEYVMRGFFSMKSDVFSFGVLLLEIVSGRSNRGFYDSEHSLSLLDHAWMLWNETRSLELLEPSIGDSCSTSEVLISIQVGLLCVQESATDRPDMASIVSMLTSETTSLTQPGKPAFSSGRTVVETEAPPVGQIFCSINEVTISVLEPR